MMRRAAVTAGLIPDSAVGQARLSFVTEGEASLHFCIQKGLTNDAIKVRNLSSQFLCRKPHLRIRAAKASLLLMLAAVLLILVPTSRHSKVVKPLKRLLPHSVRIFAFLISSYFNPGIESGFFKGSIFVTSNAKDFLESEPFPLCIIPTELLLKYCSYLKTFYKNPPTWTTFRTLLGASTRQRSWGFVVLLDRNTSSSGHQEIRICVLEFDPVRFDSMGTYRCDVYEFIFINDTIGGL